MARAHSYLISLMNVLCDLSSVQSFQSALVHYGPDKGYEIIVCPYFGAY